MGAEVMKIAIICKFWDEHSKKNRLYKLSDLILVKLQVELNGEILKRGIIKITIYMS